MGFFKRHRILAAILVLSLFTVPSIIDTYWDLYQKFKDVSMPSLNLSFGIWLLPLIGFILAIIIIWQNRRPTIPRKGRNLEIEDIHIECHIPIDSEMKRNMKRVKYDVKKLRKSIEKSVHNYFEKDNKKKT